MLASFFTGCKNTNGSEGTLLAQIAKTFAVTITQPDNGTITATKDGKAFTYFAKVEHGTKLTFTLKANANYYAKKLSANENEKTIENINEAMQELQLEIKITANTKITGEVAKVENTNIKKHHGKRRDKKWKRYCKRNDFCKSC